MCKSILASNDTKEKILQAIENHPKAKLFLPHFEKKDFYRIIEPDSTHYAAWSAHWKNITILVWEVGDDVSNWIVHVQSWNF